MKGKIKNILSKKIFYVILGILLVGIVEIVYASTLINSKNVSYSNETSKLSSTNVQGAIDELYSKCKENETASYQLKRQAVKSGDGLYQDEIEPDKYFFRGKNPNNYIKFNNELWRIININEDGSIRIRRNESIGSYAYDNLDRTSSNGFCNEYYKSGCSIWGAINSVKDVNGNSIQSASRLATESTTYKLPDKEAYLNTYLNTIYYQTLSNKDLIKIDATYNIGPVRFEYSDFGQTLKTDVSQAEKYKWFGKIALIDITDYPRTNTNQENCGSVMLNLSGINENYATCKNTTWIYNLNDEKQYLINNFSLSQSGWDLRSDNVYSIYPDGSIINGDVTYKEPTYPVLTLKANISLSNSKGTTNDPYLIK